MAAEVHLNERVKPRGGSPLTSFAGAVGVFRLFLRETVVSAMIHGHVFSVTLLSAVVGAADVGASWVGLLCLCGWGGQTQRWLRGEKNSWTKMPPAAVERPGTPLSHLV